MPAGDLYNYKAMVAALETRFGSTHQAKLHWMHLRNRTRRRDESLPELAEDTERLARLVYPEVAVRLTLHLCQM